MSIPDVSSLAELKDKPTHIEFDDKQLQNLIDNLLEELHSPIAPKGPIQWHDSRNAPPEGFVLVKPLPENEPIVLQIGLRGRDTPGLLKRLYEISTPGTPSYGKHLRKEEAESYARPPDNIISKLIGGTWLLYYGVQFKSISPSNNRLQITLSASLAKKIFNATFCTYRHEKTGTTSYQVLSYYLPSALKDIIESVEPTTSFPWHPHSRPVAHESFIRKSNIINTPSVLTRLYGIPTTKADTQTRNLLSVVGFSEKVPGPLRQFANRSDLNSFLQMHRPDLTTSTGTATFTERFINGGENLQNDKNSGEEANLDIQYTVGLVNFAPVEFFSSGDGKINSWISMANDWLRRDNLPTVISISYGGIESEDPHESWVSKRTATTLSTLYAQLGARGVSILVSTGDGGVGASRKPPYNFMPNFPASCPYVTAVGATKGYPEVASTLSSGGFSNFFTRDNDPSDTLAYQKDAVDGYLDKIGSLYEGRFNPRGRAYPDISAQGDYANVAIVHNGHVKLTGGTSASTPINASIITLLNDRLIRQKGRSLGFLNPLLYANPTFFNDITEGSNSGRGTEGFPAKPGWDAATGLGTLNFVKMAKVILAPSMGNGNIRRNLWVKHPDGNIKQIVPGASIVPNNMVPGNYEIASAEIVTSSPVPPPPPPGTNVFVANVGKGDLVFSCPWIDDENFILPNGSWKVLADVDYVVSSVNN